MSDADKIIEGLKGELESLRAEVATLKKEAVVHRRTEKELRRTTQERETISYALRAVLMNLTITEGLGGRETIKKTPAHGSCCPGRGLERLLQRSDHGRI